MRPSTVDFKRKGFASLGYNCSRKVKRTTESQETVLDKKRKVEKLVGKRGLDVLHIFHTKCLIARTRRVSSVLTCRWRLYMITTMSTGAWNFLGVSREILSTICWRIFSFQSQIGIHSRVESKTTWESKFFKESSERSINRIGDDHP